ncbi:beta strand repeat-containing protein [Ramlibacter montanisoli]|uniref:Uncharacterized protein n=1 Tax=Ramlibacter montanisoli TaxID=2732512 RepID=A0A849K3Y3_9BURK|nr:hypothetical protein [Ramlibacter montanisoli]NNU43172.1 hypothetical protein [Ramlibacter montanisoli]
MFDTFDQGDVDLANDTVNLGSSPLVTGDAVTYRKGENENNLAVGGLDNGGRYFLRNDGGVASFYNTKANAMAGDVSIDPTGRVDATAETLSLAPSHGLDTGDRVVYRAGGGTAIGGLVDGNAYFVRVQGDDVTFYDTKQHARDGGALGRVNLTDDGTGTSHKLVTRVNLTQADDDGTPSSAFGTGHVLTKSEFLEAQDAVSQDANSLKGGGEVDQPNVKGIDSNGDEAGGTTAIPGQRNLTANTATVQGVAIAATSRDDIETYAAGIGGGTVGVAIAAAVNVVNVNTSAFIGANADVNTDASGAASGQSVSVSSGSDFHHVALAAGAGFGAVGVAPGVDVTVLGMTTTASIGAGADVRARNDVSVDAHATEDVLMIGMGIAAGSVGVGGGVSVLSITNETKASIKGDVHAGGDVAVRASDDTSMMMISGALGAGFVGVGASVGVTVISKDTQAFVDDFASVDAKGHGAGVSGVLTSGLTSGDAANGFSTETRHGLVVQATSSEELLHIGVAAAGGFVGVSGAVTVSVVDSDTQAWIGDADINQEAIAFLTTDVDIATDAIALGTGTGLVNGDSVTYRKGSGAAVGGLEDGRIYYVRSLGGGNFALYDTAAHAIAGGDPGRKNLTSVGGGVGHAFVNADAASGQGVFVGAANEARATTFAGAIAGGFVGVGAAVSVGVLTNDTSAQILGGSAVTANDNVEANAASIKEVDGFVLAGAAGVVGVAASVSVWSIGSAMTSDYSDNNEDGSEGTSGNALQVGSGPKTADQDAADQGQAASGQVGSQLGGAFGPTPPNDPEADKTSDGRMAGVVNGSVATLNANSLSAAEVGSALGAGPEAIKGTSATIASNSKTTAGGDIRVQAVEDLEVDLVTGGVAAGLVGVGAGISVTNIASNVTAAAGGTLSAGGTLRVSSDLDEDVDVLALAGAAGFVGVGAAVSVVNDASTSSAGLSAGATVVRAGAIDIDAKTDQNFLTETPALATGAGAIGASFTKISIDNPGATETRAYIGANAQIGQGVGTVGSVEVNADSTIDTKATAFGISVGAIAGSINFAFVNVSPEVTAEVGDSADIRTTGSVTVDADTRMTAEGKTQGFAGGAGSLAGSFVFANLAPAVSATLGSGATVHTTTGGGNVRFRARYNTLGGDGAVATALAGAGGALLGASGAVAFSDSEANVTATMSGTITAGGGVTIAGEADNEARSTAAGVALGTVGVGLSLSDAHVGGSVNVLSNGNVTANSLTVKADADNVAESETFALAGGLIAVGVNFAQTDLDTTVSARLGSASTVSTTNDVAVQALSHNTGTAVGHGVTVGGIAVGGMATKVDIGRGDGVVEVNAGMDDGADITHARFVTIDASNTNDAWASGQAAGGGAIAVTGALVEVDSDQSTQVTIGTGATIANATSVSLRSLNQENLDMKSEALQFGLATGGGALASVEATGDALISVGNNAQITAVNVLLSARNAFDKTRFDTLNEANLASASVSLGGVTALLSDTDVGTDSNEFQARIDVGSGAKITSAGNNAAPGLLRLESFTDVEALDKVETEAYGLLGISLGKSDVSMDTRSTVNIDGATVRSVAGDVEITTRSNGYARTDVNTTIAVAISGAGGSVAITDIETHNDILLNSATVKGKDVKLFAGRDANGQVNISDGYANANVQAYSLLPAIGVPIAAVTLDEHNNIQVTGNSKVQALQNIYLRSIEGIGGDARGHESGDVLSLSLIPYGVSVDDNANTNSTNVVNVATTAKIEAGINNQSVLQIKPVSLLPSGINIGDPLDAATRTALGLDADIPYHYAALDLATIPFAINTGTVIKVVAGANAGGTVGNFYQFIPVSQFSQEVVLEQENFANTARWRPLGPTLEQGDALANDGTAMLLANVVVYDSNITSRIRTAVEGEFFVIKPVELDAPQLIYKNLGNVLLEQRDKVMGWIASHSSNPEAVARYQVQLELIDEALAELGLLEDGDLVTPASSRPSGANWTSSSWRCRTSMPRPAPCSWMATRARWPASTRASRTATSWPAPARRSTS